jgi:hypothetical protein
MLSGASEPGQAPDGWFSMRRHAPLFGLGLVLACLAAFAVYGGWAFYAGSNIGDGWVGPLSVWPYLLAGGLTVAAVIALFVWLASYSERRGYDDRAGLDKR